MAKYEHRDADNRWHAFSDADNQVIEDAYRANKNKILLTMPQNPPGLREFEVRFGDNARSERMPRPPSTKIIQVNVASGATRIVRRIASPRGSNSAAMTRASSFADDPALYGWLLRRATSGWRRGAWQRRFRLGSQELLSPLFHRGLHREVRYACNADPSAPAAVCHASRERDGLY